MVDVSGMHLYPESQVRDPATGALTPGAEGDVRLVVGGDPLPIYDSQGNPLDRLRSDGYGVAPQFYCPSGGAKLLHDFGSKAWWAWPESALENASEVPELRERVIAAEESAQRAATAAAAAAADAQTAAEAALSGGGGGTTTQPVDTTSALAAYTTAKGAAKL